jgi:hypothetical protein
MKLATFLMLAGFLCGQPAPESEVRQLMVNFVTAFENLDWPAFRQCWVENPVVFFPALDMRPGGMRTDNASEFNSAWQRVFDEARQNMTKSGVRKAPFFQINPEDLRIDFPAPTVAVVTFHLHGGTGIGRRMFVVVKTAAGWKISHLHASSMALAPPN